MFVISNFLYAVSTVLDYLLTFYMWIIIIRAFISWVSPDPYNPIVRFLYQVETFAQPDIFVKSRKRWHRQDSGSSIKGNRR